MAHTSTTCCERFVLIALACLATTYAETYACSCASAQSAIEGRKQANAVFSGRVIAKSVEVAWSTIGEQGADWRNHVLAPSGKDVEPWMGMCLFRQKFEEHGIQLCSGQAYSIRFSVFQVWKGEVPEEVEITTSVFGENCGYHFEMRKNYIVYAYRRKDGQLTTNICARTSVLEDAKADITVLDPPTTDYVRRRAKRLSSRGQDQP